MTSSEVKKYKERISGLIDRRKLIQAIDEMKLTARKNAAWQIIDKIDHAAQSYAYMLQYVADGVADPERKNVYNTIVAELYAVLDLLTAYLEKSENNSLYYSTLRLFEMVPDADRISRLVDEYAQADSKMSLFSMIESGGIDSDADRRRLEKAQSDLFSAIWVKPGLSGGDHAALAQMIDSDTFSSGAKTHALSAIMLGLLQHFDDRRLDLLMHAYGSDDMKVSSAALVGLLLALWTYRNRPLPAKLQARLDALRDTPQWSSDLRTAFLELIRARDTERITKKITDEVIPTMLNLRPEIMEKINNGTIKPEEMSSLDENPEWREMLDKNGVTDKLKELTEWQMQGGDVMMSTFSHLKQFAFFNDISNWFLPFTLQHSNIAKSVAEMDSLGMLLEGSSFFCDNDKYSFALALGNVPQAQRDLMTSQFKAQSDSILQAMGEDANATRHDARRKAVNQYLQNVYRFFKLFRRKSEFDDPFADSLNLISVLPLASDFDEPQLLEVVAEFYFQLGYMEDALDVFARLEQLAPGDAPRYQKMGYANERLAHVDKAIKHYQKAELYDSDSVWTKRRLASCFRAIGDSDNALKYYKELSTRLPEDMNLALILGYVLLEKGDVEMAVKQFYMVEYLDEKSTKSLRPLAWSLFLKGDYEASQRYYDKVVLDSPTANDFLNMGHLALAKGDLRTAVARYSEAVDARSGDFESFARALADDDKALKAAGIDSMLVAVVSDAVMSKKKNQS